ncbi:MAG: hypothetical protein IH863_05630 [Chloroflexi bacterium]|nr:hypothetical protein [Chloroflexota bacterium]
MDWLLIFGSLSVGAMLAMYALEERGRVYVAGFAAACAASSVYAFFVGAYPFAVIEVIWAAVAVRRWFRRSAAGPRQQGVEGKMYA